MKTHRIIYKSQATRALGTVELERLLQQARIYNFSQHITGGLFRGGAQYLHVLEGPEAAIEALYQHIAHDVRHTRVVELVHAPISQPLFANSALGFAQVDAGELAQLATYLDPDHLVALMPEDYDAQEVVTDLLLEFMGLQCPQLLGQPGGPG